MSQRTLSDAEIKLLEKGLKFTPTPCKSNNQEIQEDIAEFTRKIRLAEYFYECEDDDISLVKNKSNFYPPKYRNQALEDFAKSLENIPTVDTSGTVRDNLSRREREAIKSLSSDSNIIIKEADKGGGDSYNGQVTLQNNGRRNSK